MIRQFGASITKKHKEAYASSERWNGKLFENYVKTTMDINLKTLPGIIREGFKGRKDRDPKQNIPVLPFSSEKFEKDGTTKFIWYGHSVVLLQLANQNILIDPMFGPDASPIGPVRTKRFSKNTLDIIDSLPAIDAVLITHDHYDHLDLYSIEKLQKKVSTWLVALGVGRHLEKWGIPADQITEFDWWQEFQLNDIQLTFTPSRHFSGRGLTDRAKSLWGGWVLKTSSENIYWSGDGGYGDHFKEVGKRLGPFDIGFMECGQYNEHWHQIHMYPEECVQAALKAGVAKALPVHWGGFTLAQHHWKDSIERFTKEAKAKELNIITPEIGRLCTIDDEIDAPWWDNYN
jgi:L-ascorbate metabolism protein UlaG (beta-lactamase superfamily)